MVNFTNTLNLSTYKGMDRYNFNLDVKLIEYNSYVSCFDRDTGPAIRTTSGPTRIELTAG
jgi:hypothetical protein